MWDDSILELARVCSTRDHSLSKDFRENSTPQTPRSIQTQTELKGNRLGAMIQELDRGRKLLENINLEVKKDSCKETGRGLPTYSKESSEKSLNNKYLALHRCFRVIRGEEQCSRLWWSP